MAYIDDVYSVVQIQPTGIEAFVRLSQNENGRRLYFAITGGEIPTGSTATLSGTKPDGVVYSTTGTISGNVVTILEDIQLTAAAGPWSAKLRILNGGNVVATGRIRFVIDPDTVAAGAVPSDSQLEGLVAEAAAYAEAAKDGAYYGSPLTASTVAGMTDTNRVYVYTGSESGYTAGNWYYYNGSAWTSGGVYNATAIQTDKTLSVTGMAADAKATGDALAAVQVETDKTLTQADVPADAKVVGDEIADLKADLDNLVIAAEDVIVEADSQKDFSDTKIKLIGSIVTGYLWNTTNGSQETNEAARYCRFDGIGEYTRVYVSGSSVDANHRTYAIYDSNNVRLSVQPGSGANGVHNNTVVVPSGASYIIVNSLTISGGDTARNITPECYALKPGETPVTNDMSTLSGTVTTGFAWRINDTPLSNSNCKYARYDTIPESKYIYVTGFTYRVTCPLIAFYNAADGLLGYHYGTDASTTYYNEEIQIPSGTAYFIVNGSGSSITVLYSETSGEQVTQADVNESVENTLAKLTNKVDRKDNYLQFVVNSYGENVYIWIPSGDSHYIKYIFEHTVVQSKNADVWRITAAYLCDSNFDDIIALTTGGEWECALRLENRSDFSGGRAHGDEIYSGITFIIDGTVISDITSYTSKTMFAELKILQTSALYDPDNQSTKIADHMSEHIFTDYHHQCIIKQSVQWAGNYNIANCYLAMFPISKEVSDDWYNDFSFSLVPISYGTYKHITKIETNGYNKKIWSRFGIKRYVSADYTGNGDVTITDNSGNAYNKCYYTISSGAGGTAKAGEVVADEVWQSESFYGFKYVE